MKTVKYVIAIGLFLFGLSSCQKDPQEAIVGKWELVERVAILPKGKMKWYPIPDRERYREFFSDGTYGNYVPDKKEVIKNGVYKINNRLLILINDVHSEPLFFKYKFSKNRLQLTFLNEPDVIMMYPPKILIYQRKN